MDLNTLETVLDDHEMIEKAEVFSSLDGSLNAHIKQKTPIVRYVSDNAKYYLDSKGVNYTEKKLGKSKKIDSEFSIRTRRAKKIPQIFINNEWIALTLPVEAIYSF